MGSVWKYFRYNPEQGYKPIIWDYKSCLILFVITVIFMNKIDTLLFIIQKKCIKISVKNFKNDFCEKF